jgi:hypothetical protein
MQTDLKDECAKLAKYSIMEHYYEIRESFRYKKYSWKKIINYRFE